jgi:hypothetical protein
MLRLSIPLVIATISIGISVGNAESMHPASSSSPGEISIASHLLAEKQESCRLEAKRQKLTFFKRRVFMHRCRKGKT